MAILERKVTDGVAHLTMNAPERLNALSDEMILALHTTLDDIAETRSIRAVILSGSGKAFCAGHDLKQMTEGRQKPDGGRGAACVSQGFVGPGTLSLERSWPPRCPRPQTRRRSARRAAR